MKWKKYSTCYDFKKQLVDKKSFYENSINKISDE